MNATKFLGRLNTLSMIVNIVVVIIFLIWFPVGSINRPKMNTDDFVWTQVINGTDWPTGISFLMGYLSVIWTISGFDAPYC